MQDNKRKCLLRPSLLSVLLLCLWAAFGGPQVQAASEKGLTSTTLMYALGDTKVYETPDTAGQVLGQLKKDDTLFAVELQNGWYRVVYQGESGYVVQMALAEVGREAGEWEEPSAGAAAGNEALQESVPEPDGEALQESVPEPDGEALRESVPEPGAGERQESVQMVNLDISEVTEQSDGLSAATVIFVMALMVIAMAAGAAAGLILKKKKTGKRER